MDTELIVFNTSFVSVCKSAVAKPVIRGTSAKFETETDCPLISIDDVSLFNTLLKTVVFKVSNLSFVVCAVVSKEKPVIRGTSAKFETETDCPLISIDDVNLLRVLLVRVVFKVSILA